MDGLEAEERLGQLDVALAPWVKEDGQRRRLIRDLMHRARRWLNPKPAPPAVREYDPRKAAEWLRARGVEVIEDDGRDV